MANVIRENCCDGDMVFILKQCLRPIPDTDDEDESIAKLLLKSCVEQVETG